MSGLRILSTLTIAAGLLSAAGLELSRPLAGTVFTPASKSLRPIFGFPGAAYLGPSILNEVEWACISPDGNSALVRSAGGFSLFTGLRSGELSSRPLPAPEADVMAAWSRGSHALVILYVAEKRLQVLQFDEQSPGEREIETPPGTVRSLAIDDTGELVLVATAGESGGTLWLADQAAPRPVPLPGPPAALCLAGEGKEAIVLDESGTALYRIQDVRGAAEIVSLTFPAQDEFLVSSIAEAGAKAVLALDREHRRAWIIDLESGLFSAEARFEWTPESAYPLAHPSLFAIGGAASAGEPLYVLSTRDGLNAFFVPQSPE